MIKIFIADDHILIRQGLKKIILDIKDMKVVGEAENAEQLREKLKGSDAEIVLLDLNLPGTGLFDLIDEIKNLNPEMYILIVTVYPEKAYAIRAIRHGAHGFLTKDESLETLELAIRTIIKSGKFLSPEVGILLAEEISLNENAVRHNVLSDRELEILRMISKGNKIKDIADTLSLSVSTVNTYRLRILKKMNMETDAEMVRYAIENKLII